MSGQRREIEDKLKSLPDSFTADEIETMYANLVNDADYKQLRKTTTHNSRLAIETRLHKKHEMLAYSYPTIFFKTVRNEMDPHILKSLMDIKRKMEKGELTDEGAKRAVIDGAKAHVMSDPNRPKRVTQPGSTVQEITVKCKVEDEDLGN